MTASLLAVFVSYEHKGINIENYGGKLLKLYTASLLVMLSERIVSVYWNNCP